MRLRGCLFGTFSVTAYIAVLLFSGCSGRPRVETGTIPKEQAVTKNDVQAGFETARLLSAKFPLMKDKKARNIISRVARRLVRAAELKNRWRVVLYENNRMVNAAATKGNFIFVWSGLLHFVRSEDELAAVLAHEIGHVLANHSLKDPLENLTNGFVNKTATLSSTLREEVQRISAEQPCVAQCRSAHNISLALAYTALGAKKLLFEPEKHRKEVEADTIGLLIMSKAGYNPKNAIQIIKRIEDLQKKLKRTPHFVKNHPAAKTRIDNLRSILANPDLLDETSSFNS